MGVADLFLVLKGIQNLFTAVSNMVPDEDLTPEFLDARDEVRERLVTLANEL